MACACAKGGLCCGLASLGSRRARSFSGGRQFEQVVGLGPDPGRPQLGDDLSVKPRASELGPWSASLVWSSLSLGSEGGVALDLDFGLAAGV